MNASWLHVLVSSTISSQGVSKYAPAAIPEIESQVSHELSMAVFNIDGCSKPTDVFRHIVTEDDRPHRRLSGATLAHQEHLFLSLARVHAGDELFERRQSPLAVLGIRRRTERAGKKAGVFI